MKIIHICWGLTIGGIETMLVNIANAQIQAGADVNIIVINDLYDTSVVNSFNSSVKIIFLNRRIGSRSLNFLFKLNHILRKFNPDAIHLHCSRIYGMILSRKYRRRASVTLHAIPTGGLLRKNNFLYRLLPILSIQNEIGNVTFIDRIPRVFAISNSVKDALWANYMVNSSVILNGIRTADFATREKLAPHSPLRIVQVSRLEHVKKGQDLLIEAIAKLNGIAEVDFIGEGDSKEHLQSLAKSLGVADKIHFLGKKSQSFIAENLKNYDLFVQPSRKEGFGLTIAETMSAQLPVLVSSGEGPAEITCNDTFGWVFRSNDVNDLTRAIKYIAEHYDEALSKVEAARNHVVKNYDVSTTAKQYLKNYR